MTNNQPIETKRCIPYQGGVSAVSLSEISKRMSSIPKWNYDEKGKLIIRIVHTNNFIDSLRYANKIGALAETVGHHPDLTISWGKLTITLSTHEIGGLSEKDFILAAQLDTLIGESTE